MGVLRIRASLDTLAADHGRVTTAAGRDRSVPTIVVENGRVLSGRLRRARLTAETDLRSDVRCQMPEDDL
jgi:hypothetical protein